MTIPPEVAILARPAAPEPPEPETAQGGAFFMRRLLELAFPPTGRDGQRDPDEFRLLRQATERAAPELAKLLAEAEQKGRELERAELERAELETEIGLFDDHRARIEDELLRQRAELESFEAEVAAQCERLVAVARTEPDAIPALTGWLNEPGPSRAAVWGVVVFGIAALVVGYWLH